MVGETIELALTVAVNPQHQVVGAAGQTQQRVGKRLLAEFRQRNLLDAALVFEDQRVRRAQAGLCGVFVIGSLSDMFDGSVARMSGKATRFGAFLDSNLDRFGEGLVLGGIGVAMATEARTWAVAMTFLALAGSFLVSYTRARAEGLGVDSNKGGLFSRTERLVLVGAALFLGGWGITIEVVMTILAVGTIVTFVQRLFYVHSVLRDADGPPEAR